MTYQVLTTLKVKTRQGEAILTPGQIISLDPAKANSLLTLGRIKPTETKSMTESLEEVMNAIVLTSRDRIIEIHKGRQYRASDEIQKAEEEVNCIYHEVLKGQGKLAEYQNACKKWESLFICKD